MNKLIKFFTQRPLVANILMFGTIILAISLWGKIGKEERPEFAFNWVRVSIPYPGASAQDVELFVLRPIEEQLKGVSGLYEVNSSAAFGRANIRVTLNPNTNNEREKIQEIKDAVERADLPLEVEDPVFDRYTSAEKAIIDVAIYLEGKKLLNVQDRQRLHEYAITLKNRLLALKEVSGGEQRGYIKPELQIKVYPERLKEFEVPVSVVADQIRNQHIRTPLGVMENENESEVSLFSYLDNVKDLKKTVIRNSFQEQKLLLEDLALVQEGFARSTSIRKIQGHEAVVFNVQKTANVGILDARDAINNLISDFRRNNEGNDVRVQLLDDESYDVRNRLSLIATNGFFGFLIILVILFIFLDFKSGFWVAMGLPFTLGFTLIGCMLAGYTVNNITLAAVIIVLGIVVDDAIIVADSIQQKKEKGEDSLDEVSKGTSEVILPILASILTTCCAFIPLLFFKGRFGMFVKFMPLVIYMMLGASLFESILILPSHMLGKSKKKSTIDDASWMQKINKTRRRWLDWLEAHYQSFVSKALDFRITTLALSFIILAGTLYVFQSKMRFVMFPREESKEFAVKVIGPEGTSRLEMAKLVEKVEDLFIDDKFNSVVGFRTVIGESRRGGEVRENEANLRVELLPPDEQKAPFDEMIDYWKEKAKELKDFQEVRFLESWWSSSSGSPIAIEVQENNDERRKKVSEKLKQELEKISALKNVEIEKPLEKESYQLDLNKSESIRLNINPAQLAQNLRAYIEGQILYRVNNGEEEIDVRLTSQDQNKSTIQDILSMPTTNSENYMVPIGQLVELKKVMKPTSINRVNFKRASYVYADMNLTADMTPLEIAEYLEKNIFPNILKESPSTILNFRGEIEDSRESKSDFALSIVLIVVLIYILLVFLFSSLTTPIVIGAALPFGVVGVIWAFYGHGLDKYGFFAVIGALGMLGVVINDSIVLVDKFELEFKQNNFLSNYIDRIKEISTTRLRPVILTTLTTVAGVFPTAYGIGGYDSMLADMMLAMGWGLLFGTVVTLFIVPVLYSFLVYLRLKNKEEAI